MLLWCKILSAYLLMNPDPKVISSEFAWVHSKIYAKVNSLSYFFNLSFLEFVRVFVIILISSKMVTFTFSTPPYLALISAFHCIRKKQEAHACKRSFSTWNVTRWPGKEKKKKTGLKWSVKRNKQYRVHGAERL